MIWNSERSRQPGTVRQTVSDGSEETRIRGEKTAALDSLVKPELPDFVDGKYWNKRIYGTDGKYNIYLDNKRVNISNEEAEKLEGYLAAVDAYDKKVRELKEWF